MLLLHVIKKISLGLWLEMIFIQLILFYYPLALTHKDHIQPQTMEDPIFHLNCRKERNLLV